MPLWLNTHLCPLISSKAKRTPEFSLLYVPYRKQEIRFQAKCQSTV